jgi:hypothetical protein
VSGGAISSLTPVAASQEWKVLKTAPGNALSTNLVATSAPERVSRTLVGGNLGAHVVTLDRNSSIAYDAREHRFVNTNSAPTRTQEGVVATETREKTVTSAVRGTGDAVVPGARASTTTAPARTSVPASRAMVPPPSPRSAESGRSGWSGGGFGPSSRSASSSAASSSAAHSGPTASAGSSSGGRAH